LFPFIPLSRCHSASCASYHQWQSVLMRLRCWPSASCRAGPCLLKHVALPTPTVAYSLVFFFFFFWLINRADTSIRESVVFLNFFHFEHSQTPLVEDKKSGKIVCVSCNRGTDGSFFFRFFRSFKNNSEYSIIYAHSEFERDAARQLVETKGPSLPPHAAPAPTSTSASAAATTTAVAAPNGSPSPDAATPASTAAPASTTPAADGAASVLSLSLSLSLCLPPSLSVHSHAQNNRGH
jgi:hypothetical protein